VSVARIVELPIPDELRRLVDDDRALPDFDPKLTPGPSFPTMCKRRTFYWPIGAFFVRSRDEASGISDDELERISAATREEALCDPGPRIPTEPALAVWIRVNPYIDP
jgi:hypothetical protein